MAWFKKKKKKNAENTREQNIADAPEPYEEDETVMADFPSAKPQFREEKPLPPKSKSKPGIVGQLKKGLSKTRDFLTTDIEDFFKSSRSTDELLEEIEERLITSDMGVETAMAIMEKVSKKVSKISDANALKKVLREEIISLFKGQFPAPRYDFAKPHVVMVIGVNGVGKTTTIGKLAAKAASENKKVLIAAADTFRAAAVEQLAIWAERAGADIVRHRENADPASVAYDAVEAAVARNKDIVFVDTAGRLHTKVNLMEELKKIKRAITKKIPDAPHEILLVLDATTGQNALSQAKMFDDALGGVTAIALTKLDGTARGGIVVSICNTMNIPLEYIGVGEQIDDLQNFDPVQFAEALF